MIFYYLTLSDRRKVMHLINQAVKLNLLAICAGLSLGVGLYLALPMQVEAVNYSVSPPIIDLELEKRDIVYKEITITNKDSRQIRIFPSVNEVNLDENGAIESFVEPSMIDDRTAAITSWIEVPRRRIEIKPGESATVPVTFKVNPNVTAGEYHAIIGFGSGSNQPQAHVQVANGIAPVVAVRVGVDQVQEQFLRLERFSVERLITDRETGTLSYTLHNPGADPVLPAGEIIFYDTNGDEVDSMSVNPAGLTVEAGKKLEIVDETPNDLRMGKYKAFLSVEYGEHLTASVHDTAFFYILPLRQLIIIFVVVLIVSIFIGLYVHWRYDVDDDYDEGSLADIPMYIRTDRSEGKEHDIDLSKKE